MTNERDFYRELGKVPEIPSVCYENVHRTIRRRAAFFRTALALAAMFIIAAVTTSVLVVRGGNEASLSPEVTDELQMVHSYLTSTDLEKEYESYVLYEGN
jgi:hypothetical protein